MYPNSIYLGLKVLPKQVHWALSIYYLGTWTLREHVQIVGLKDFGGQMDTAESLGFRV